MKSKQVRELTHHDTFDVFWPSGDRRIVYENGGSIYLYDPTAAKSSRVPIRIEGDLPRTMPYFKNVTEDVETASISPSGKRVLLTARGELFSVPAEKGEIRNLTHSSGVRETAGTWSPDGRWAAYLSDRTGEYEIWVRPTDGSGEERQVTKNGGVWRFQPAWSPDSKKLAFGDKNRKLFWVDAATGKTTEADESPRGDIQDYKWSPDSRCLAYTKPGSNSFPSIWIYALDDAKARQLTSDGTADAEPTGTPPAATSTSSPTATSTWPSAATSSTTSYNNATGSTWVFCPRKDRPSSCPRATRRSRSPKIRRAPRLRPSTPSRT